MTGGGPLALAVLDLAASASQFNSLPDAIDRGAAAVGLFELTQDLRFIDLFATGGLTRVGADSRLFAGSHMIAKQWSAAFRLHPCKPDGIRYPARHDHTRAACAIFSRPVSTFKVSSLGSLMASANRALLSDILTLYIYAPDLEQRQLKTIRVEER